MMSFQVLFSSSLTIYLSFLRVTNPSRPNLPIQVTSPAFLSFPQSYYSQKRASGRKRCAISIKVGRSGVKWLEPASGFEFPLDLPRIIAHTCIYIYYTYSMVWLSRCLDIKLQNSSKLWLLDEMQKFGTTKWPSILAVLDLGCGCELHA